LSYKYFSFSLKLTKAYEALWFIFQPLLFGIIGSRIDLGIVDWGIIYKGIICLGISTMVIK
jgi:hypothetical protein